jgi:hypothetical protein
VDKGVTISGGGKFTVFVTHKGVTIANLTITGGKDFHLSPAGGILDTGALVIKQSTIAGNAGAGAIFGDNVTVINSTVTNNLGTGINYKFQGTFTLINSTVSNNAAGIDAFDVESGPKPTVLLKNSIIAGNQTSCGLGAAFLDGFSYAGVNISSDKTCGTPILNMIVADPLLGNLADNGGPTQTRALDRNSPAINATNCPDVTVDQRFVPRDAKCDIGAFEFVFTTISLTIDPTAQVDPSTGAATVTGTIQCSRNEAFNLAVELTQNQKHKGTPVVVDDTEVIGVSCGTTAKPWIAQVTPPAGVVFDNSDATVSATTVAIANGVIPRSVSTAVKVFRQK